ncbi:hypothetical protein BV20DRAFT_983097 [Pilatotrama ljubarskyi]|nr:hypothetical protein BV20DRAFT_983097 [Pilatotrama ljubarskyi]
MPSTRSSNSETRPGIAVAPRKRRTAEEVAAEKAQKALAKLEKEKAKKAKELEIAALELEMQANEAKIRELREKHSKHEITHQTRSLDGPGVALGILDVVAGGAAATKRKRAPAKPGKKVRTDAPSSDVHSDGMDVDDGEAPTPSPFPGGGKGVQEPSSELTEPESEMGNTETPKPPKKKIKVSKPVEQPLRNNVEAAKAKILQESKSRHRAAAADDENSVADTEAPVPSVSTATGEKKRSLVSTWAENVAFAELATPVQNRIVSAHRTVAIPATPFMGAENAFGKAKGKAKEKVKPRPINKRKEAEEVADGGIREGGYVGSEDEVTEAAAAKASPAKHGQRLTSAALVKCEDVNLATPGKPKKTAGAKGQDKKQAVKSTSGSSTTSKSTTSKSTRDSIKQAGFTTNGFSRKKGSEVADDDEEEGEDDDDEEEDDDDESEGEDKDEDDEDNATITEGKTTVKGRASKAKGGKPRSTPKNSDIPAAAHEQNAWKAKFIPTFLKAIGTRSDPWALNDREMIKLLQAIWDALYGDRLPYVITANDSVHALASQRMYEWRSAFGSSAMRTFESFFNAMVDDFPDRASRREFCDRIVPGGRIFFADPEGDSKEGLYRSPFLINSISAHIDAIQGAIVVPNLYKSPIDEYPYGAIGLAAAAALRVASLWRLRRIKYNKAGQPVVKKALNPATGKRTTTDVAFSSNNFRMRTLELISGARKLSPAELDGIVDHAYRVAQLEAPSAAEVTPPAILTATADFTIDDLFNPRDPGWLMRLPALSR